MAEPPKSTSPAEMAKMAERLEAALRKNSKPQVTQGSDTVPSLPQRNSNSTLSDLGKPDDAEEGLRAVQELARSLRQDHEGLAEAVKPLAEATRAGAANYWINRDREDREREDRKQDIAKAIRQSERSSEKTTVAERERGPLHGLLEKPFTLQDALVLALCELVAILLCDASWHAIVTEKDELARGISGLAFGVPVGIVGFAFHWLKEKVRLDWFAKTAIFWWPLALVLIFSYVAGPAIYRRALIPPVVSGYTQQQVNQMTTDAVQNALHPTPPPAPPPPPKPHYSAEEIEIMQTALRSMYAILTAQCKPAADKDWQMAASWESNRDVLNADPRAFASKLLGDNEAVRKCSADLRKIVADNGLYENELNEAMPNDFGGSLSGYLDGLIYKLNEIGKSPVKLDVISILNELLNQWQPTSANYGKWVSDTTSRVTRKIEELRNLRN